MLSGLAASSRRGGGLEQPQMPQRSARGSPTARSTAAEACRGEACALPESSLHHVPQAAQAYSDAMAQDPSLRSVFTAQLACNRAAAHAKLSRHAEAVKDCSAAIDLDPGFEKAYLRRAASLGAQARRRSVAACRQGSNSGLMLCTSVTQGLHEEALRDYEKLFEMNSEDPDIRTCAHTRLPSAPILRCG